MAPPARRTRRPAAHRAGSSGLGRTVTRRGGGFAERIRLRLRLVASPRELSRSPVGRAIADGSFLAWCATPRLVGTVHFGRRDLGDASVLSSLYSLARHPALRPPLHRVVDGRLLEGIDEDAWTRMEIALREQIESLRGLFDRQAMLVAPGLRGAQRSSLLPALGPGDSFRLFTDPAEAYAWADPSDGPAARALVDPLVSTLREDALVPRARAWIAAHLVDARVDACGRALGMSTRTLQRELTRRGASFRGLREAEQVAAARALLVESRSEVETIARAVGCSSSSQLGVLLRRAGLPSPSELRAKVSSRE